MVVEKEQRVESVGGSARRSGWFWKLTKRKESTAAGGALVWGKSVHVGGQKMRRLTRICIVRILFPVLCFCGVWMGFCRTLLSPMPWNIEDWLFARISEYPRTGYRIKRYNCEVILSMA
jgi:hypothetical protein